MTQPNNAHSSGNRKMSEMISEMAAGFLGIARRFEEKQNCLNAACSAWNLDCGSPEVRQRQLGHYREGYLRSQSWDFSSGSGEYHQGYGIVDRKEAENVPGRPSADRSPGQSVGNGVRIEIASATLP